MPKNKGKGGKNRRRGKNENETTKREIVFKEEGQEYAQVLKMLGNGRLQAYCFDGSTRLCHIRGKLRKKIWINAGDIILLGLRDYQDKKADVIQKYNADEARNLKSYGELPDTVKINEGGAGDEDVGIEFTDAAAGAEGDDASDKEKSSSGEESDSNSDEESGSESESDEDDEEEDEVLKKAPVHKIQISKKHEHQQKRGGKRDGMPAADIDNI